MGKKRFLRPPVHIITCLKFVAAYLDDGFVFQDETRQNERGPRYVRRQLE